MSTLNKMFKTGLGITVLLAGLTANAWGVVVGGGAGVRMGGGGGEVRGPSIIGGRVICTQCDIEQVREGQPDLMNLYELHHVDGQVVMQVEPREDTLTDDVWWLSDGAIRWKTIAGLANSVSVRTPSYLFQQLMEEENLMKQVQINGLLRTTNTYDVVSVNYLDPTPGPLAFGQQAQDAAQRAAAAAARAEAAAGRAEGAAERTENTTDRLMAMTDTTEDQFAADLRK